MSDLRCWQCGVEPTDIVEVTAYADVAQGRRVYLPARWPDGDHEHEVNPPTPAELAEGGDAALARIIDSWREA